MQRVRLLLLIHAVLAGLASPSLHAADAGPDERLRVAYRDAVTQLQSAQSDLAALQANQAATAAASHALQDKYDAALRELAAARAGGDRAAASLTAQLRQRDAQLASLTTDLNAARTEWGRAAEAAKSSEAQNASLSHEVVLLRRRVSGLEVRNLGLFLTGNEILTRYQDFSLGTALKAKEPFVGLTRTKLENLVQDYRDRLDEHRDRP